MTINVLVFDRWSKCELFKEYIGTRAKTVRCIYSFEYKDALEKIKKNKPEIILLGGDVGNEELGSVILYNKMNELGLKTYKSLFISTWNADEARILRDMIPNSFYCPFSETLANIVKEKARQINKYKKSKECQKIKN